MWHGWTMSSCCGPDRVGHARANLDVDLSRQRSQSDAIPLGAAEFLMGSDDALAYPTDLEGPVREARVDHFAIAATTVTNAQFALFVEAAGYQTTAERFGDSLVFAGVIPSNAPPTPAVVGTPWWRVVAGADWQHPAGPGTDLEGLEDHPVIHVSHDDARAYATWVGGRLPTETEWEFAARGGLEQQPFPWGDEFEPSGQIAMNVWQGRFPDQPAGRVGTIDVHAFEPNGYGVWNSTGNVWEWTDSPFSASDQRPILRGGSYLCHDSYCRRYRTSARIANTPDTSTGHSGFRVAFDAAA